MGGAVGQLEDGLCAAIPATLLEKVVLRTVRADPSAMYMAPPVVLAVLPPNCEFMMATLAPDE